MLIDAHSHLNLEHLFQDWKIHLQHFQQIGGKILVNSGAHIDYNTNGILIAKEAKSLFPELTVKATIGFHPRDSKEFVPEDYPRLITQLEQQYFENQDNIIAIGECGIDLYGSDNPPLEHQQTLFKLQANLAKKLNLPLVIHSRDGFEATMEVLKDFTDLKIYFHCRGYGPDEVRIVEELLPQVRFGFTNILSYPSAKKTRESLLTVKRSHILLETDAPFLPPQTLRGQTNYPEHVKYVYEKCAEVLELEKEEVEKMIEENFHTIFWNHPD